MPLAILAVSGDPDVSILNGTTVDEVLDALREIADVSGLDTPDIARRWLLTQPAPSGWYETLAEARAAVDQSRRQDPMSADEFARIRAELGLARAQFADALGFQGSANTRHKQIWEMEKGRKPILPERARLARAALALEKLGGLDA